MFAYTGVVEVQGGDFILDADRIIIRDGEIAFKFIGSDEYGDFDAEGKATLTSDGKYISSRIKVNYSSFVSDDHATIHFTIVKPTLGKMRCKVEGKWVQGKTWSFSGNLRPYKSA